MRTRRPKRAGGAPGWVLLLLYFALAALALALFHSYTVTDDAQIFLTPVFSDDRGWDIYRMDVAGGHVALTPREAAETVGTVYLSRVLDPAYEAAGYTTLELDGPVSVFLDGELLYTTSPGSGDSPESVTLPGSYEAPVVEGPQLTLPPGYGGKTLTLAFAREETTAGTPGVRLSSRAAEAAITAVGANRLAMPAAAYMTAAFLLLGLFFYGGFQGKWDWPMLLLTLAAGLQSFYQLWEYGVYHAESALDVPAAALIPPLFTALPLCYLLSKMERAHKGRRAALVLVPAAISLLPPLLYLLNISLPDGWHTYGTEALYLSIIAVLVCAALEVRAGNQAFRIFLGGLGWGLAVLVVACLLSGEVAGYVIRVLSMVFRGLPSLPLYWCGAALFVLCAAMSVRATIGRMAEDRIKAEMLATQVLALRRHHEVVAQSEEKIRIYRHDMRFTLQTLSALLERGDTAGALEFLGQSDKKLEDTALTHYCESPVLDALLAYYAGQAGERGIQMELQVKLGRELPADEAELCAVLANALENAIHACEKLPAGTIRRIQISAVSAPHFCVEIANTFDGDVEFDSEGFPVTRDPGHGIGTRSIAAFFDKYKAVYSYSVTEDGLFRLRFLINRPHGEN